MKFKQNQEFFIDSFEDFISKVLVNHNDKEIRLYRGQENDYKLLPKILRLIFKHKKESDFITIEKRIIDEFREKACMLDNKILDYNDWDILSIAQHHGLPTRLLDWTSNPLIALWFAFSTEKDNDNDRIVWGLMIEDDSLVNMKVDNPFNTRFIKAFRPRYLNPRINAQNAWFTLQNIDIGNTGNKGGDGLPHFDKAESIEETIDLHYHLARFLVPNNLKNDILRKLNIMGINHFTLFPDLEGLSKTLEWHEFDF